MLSHGSSTWLSHRDRRRQRLSRVPEYRMKHSFAKSSRLRVPLARVVGYNEGDWRESPPAAVAEVRLRRRNVVPRQAPGAKGRIPGDATEDNHHTQLSSKSREVPVEKGLAISEIVAPGVVSSVRT